MLSITVPATPAKNETSRVPTIIGVTLFFLFVVLVGRALLIKRLSSDTDGFTSFDGFVELDELLVELLVELELDDVLDGFVLDDEDGFVLDEDGVVVSRETTLEFSFLAVALPSSSNVYSSPSMVCVVLRNK